MPCAFCHALYELNVFGQLLKVFPDVLLCSHTNQSIVEKARKRSAAELRKKRGLIKGVETEADLFFECAALGKATGIGISGTEKWSETSF